MPAQPASLPVGLGICVLLPCQMQAPTGLKFADNPICCHMTYQPFLCIPLPSVLVQITAHQLHLTKELEQKEEERAAKEREDAAKRMVGACA